MKCEKVTLEYDGIPVIKDLSFCVEKEDYLCIIGENGSGKSTLVKALLGLKKISKGKITYEEVKQSHIGYLPQQTVVQKDFPASVFEVVVSGCLNNMGFKPFYTRKEKQMATEYLALLEIESLKDRCYRELSGGQQQRVLLARALCASKKVLLLDEPTSGLDPIASKRFYELIERVNKESKITIIMVSHEMQQIEKIAKHILHIHGENTFFGPLEEYKKSEIGKHYLGGA